MYNNSIIEITNNSTFHCICRCCLSMNLELKPIFNSVGSIPQAVFLFTSVKFEENDSLPKNICTTCLDQLNRFINFKRKVETSDLTLRKCLADFCEKEGSQGLHESLKDHDYNLPVNECFKSHSNIKLDKDNKEQITASCSQDNLFRCNQCTAKFMDKTTFENHQICHEQYSPLRVSVTSPLFACPYCKEIFAVEQDFFVHSSLHEDSDEFICKSCHKTFPTFFKLKRHIPSHFKEKPFKCQLCEKRFLEMASLTRHYRVHTGPKPESKYLCLVCNKGFHNRYDLKVHNRSHTGERPWTCDSCDKRFTDFRLLNSHKKLHDENKPHECKQCNKSFRHRSTLVTHSRTHTSSNRPHRCDKCKKAYKQSWSLQIHKRTHSVSKKKLVCDQCCQMFTSTAALEDHLQWHSKNVECDNSDAPKETPSEFFQCNECPAQFSSPLDLITHQKLTHALRHECDTCFGKWKTLEELVQHKCNEVLKASDEPTPDEMIVLPNGEVQDCSTIVNTLLASVSQRSATISDDKENSKK